MDENGNAVDCLLKEMLLEKIILFYKLKGRCLSGCNNLLNVYYTFYALNDMCYPVLNVPVSL